MKRAVEPFIERGDGLLGWVGLCRGLGKKKTKQQHMKEHAATVEKLFMPKAKSTGEIN